MAHNTNFVPKLPMFSNLRWMMPCPTFCPSKPLLGPKTHPCPFKYLPKHVCLSPPPSQWVGGGVGTRPWWLALLACGGAYWPLAFEPSAMTSRHPYYCGHPHCRGHPPAWGGLQNATLPMASSPDGLISARYAVIATTPGWEVLTTTSNVNVTQAHGGGGCPYLHTSKRNVQNFPKSAKTRRVGT